MKAKYLSLLALSALLVSCGPTTSAPTDPTSTPDPTVSDPTTVPFVGPASVGLIGSFEESSWSVDVPFTPDADGRIWTIEDYPLYKGDEWKARAEGSWDLQWGYGNLDETSAALFEETGEYGGNVLILESAKYSITINAETNVMSVAKGDALEDKEFVAPESIGIIGVGGNWESNSYELSSLDEGHNWTVENVELHADDEFKLRLNNEWATSWGYSALDDASKAYFSEAEGGNIHVVEGGYFTIGLDYDNGVVSALKTGDLAVLPEVSEFVDSVIGSHELINGGAATVNNINLEYNSEDTTNYEYVFGNDKYGTFVKATEKTDYRDIVEYYLQGGNNDWYAISVSDVDGIQGAYTDPSPDMEYGVSIPLFNYRINVFGATGFLKFVADSYANHSASTFDFGDASNSFTFVTYYCYDSGNAQYNKLYEITATFSVNEDHALVGVDAAYTEYNNPVQDLETEEWNKSADSVATSSGTIVMSQTAGERTEVAPVNIDDLFYASYDLFNASMDPNYNLVVGEKANFDDVIQLNNGVQKMYALGNVEPETANPEIDEFEFDFIVGSKDGLSIRYNSYNGVLYINPSAEGDYEVKMSTAKTERVLKFHVNAAAADSIQGVIKFDDGGYYNVSLANEGDTVEFYVGQELYVCGQIMPYAADQSATVEITSGAETVTSELIKDWTPNSWTDPADVTKISAAAPTTIDVVVTSVSTPDVKVSFKIKFVAAPTIDDIVSHDYVEGYSGTVNAKVEFHPSESDASVGTVDITTSAYDSSYKKIYTTVSCSYAYDAEQRIFNLTDSEGNAYTKNTLSVSSTYKLCLDGQQLSVLTDAFFYESTNWGSRIESIMKDHEDTVGNANWAIEFGKNGTGSLAITVVDTSWNPLQSLVLDFKFTIDTKEDGSHVVVFSAETLDAIAEQSEFSNIVISFNADYSEITVAFASATYGEITSTVAKNR